MHYWTHIAVDDRGLYSFVILVKMKAPQPYRADFMGFGCESQLCTIDDVVIKKIQFTNFRTIFSLLLDKKLPSGNSYCDGRPYLGRMTLVAKY